MAGPPAGTAVAAPVAAVVRAAAAAPEHPAVAWSTPLQSALSSAVGAAAGQGVTQYVSVVDRRTGAVVAQTANAGTAVASESVVKLLLATYYLLLYGGYSSTPADVLNRLAFMLEYSDDDTMSALFSANAIPTVAARYGMSATTNATDRAGHWGAAHITAADMTTFLYRAGADPAVGPWLIPVMSRTAPNGSDGFDQHFGMNALGGTHGSKQGWGCDSFSSVPCAIHSVGYSDRYFVAVLTLAGSYPDPARGTVTRTAAAVAAASTTAPAPPAPPGNGDFVQVAGAREVYRLVGGAPLYVSNWAAVGGTHAVKTMTAAQFGALRHYPADGTVLSAHGTIYRVVGGAPLYVSSWASIGQVLPATAVDLADLTHIGSGGVWDHLRQYPADGTVLSAHGAVYRVVGGAPEYVSSWASIGQVLPATAVDLADLTHIGSGGVWDHLRQYPADGTVVNAHGTIYRIVGGAPLYVSSWASIGQVLPATAIDLADLTHIGSGGLWDHLRQYPANGAVLSAHGDVYRIAGGAPLYVSSWASIGRVLPATAVDLADLTHIGRGGVWDHLRQYPADGTYLDAHGQIYRVTGGVPHAVPGAGLPPVAIDLADITHIGRGGPWAHLR